ncbi:MAG TPA: alkaline phosphatase family protein [Nitrolancea sp.]|nr:alkaline phosphatase family protein [Nitrolancea sp.]
MRHKLLSTVVVALTLMIIAIPAIALADGKPESNGAGIPKYQHIFEIVMENHSDEQIIGNANAPKINALAQQYGLATASYGVTHPSEPNYVALIGGSYFGIQDDNAYDQTTNGVNHTIDAPTLAQQLEGAGLTWKDYQQTMPSAGFKGYDFGNGLYKSKHNPFLNFASMQNDPTELAKMVPDTQLFVDLATNNVPNFSFIVPDQCHDMHGVTGCTDSTGLIQMGDAYVNSVVTAIMASRSWQQGNNAVVVTWDEDDFEATNLGCCDANPGGGHVATIVITNHGPRGLQDSTPYNHYSLLQTVEDAFRLGCLQNTCDATNVKPMTPLFAIHGHRRD